MSIEARMQSLNERHRELDNALNEEISYPAFDEDRVQDLKRRKLAIKDELEQLKTRAPN
ncbi:MAG: DUF465 domain-containing protein [Aquisalinus sp.]|nr:DUF465 domain-containing protein [Aquisalinus sp.]